MTSLRPSPSTRRLLSPESPKKPWHTYSYADSSIDSRSTVDDLEIDTLLKDGLDSCLSPVDRAIVLANFGMTKARGVRKQIREEFGLKLTAAELHLRLQLALSNLREHLQAHGIEANDIDFA